MSTLLQCHQHHVCILYTIAIAVVKYGKLTDGGATIRQLLCGKYDCFFLETGANIGKGVLFIDFFGLGAYNIFNCIKFWERMP